MSTLCVFYAICDRYNGNFIFHFAISLLKTIIHIQFWACISHSWICLNGTILMSTQKHRVWCTFLDILHFEIIVLLIWSFVFLLIWSSVFLLIWSSLFLLIWSSLFLLIWSSLFLLIWSSSFLLIWSSVFLLTGSCVFQNSKSLVQLHED